MKAFYLNRFFRTEQFGGALLIAATIIAIGIANSSARELYHHFLAYEIGASLGIAKSVHHWINDGLMAVFFLLAGLEIRREFSGGELGSVKSAALPLAGALGGMLFPACIFMAVNWPYPDNWAGWAIPSATDIAFAIALLAVVARSLPPSLRMFLLALAILDDIGAIIVIALFYANDLNGGALLSAGVILAVMVVMRFLSISRFWPYLLSGLALWVAVSHSGVHATLSGILIAFLLPKNGSSLERAEDMLHPWTAFLILPLFAFANAGLDLKLDLDDFYQPLPLGVSLGLFLGKQLGVMIGAALAVGLKWAYLPKGANWPQLYGVAILTGVGFTMSLFIGSLGFHQEEQQNLVRLGVLGGSLASAVTGIVWLIWVTRHKYYIKNT